MEPMYRMIWRGALSHLPPRGQDGRIAKICAVGVVAGLEYALALPLSFGPRAIPSRSPTWTQALVTVPSKQA